VVCLVLVKPGSLVAPHNKRTPNICGKPPGVCVCVCVCALSDDYDVGSTDLVHDILLVKKLAPMSNSGLCGWTLIHVRRPIALLPENSHANLYLWMS